MVNLCAVPFCKNGGTIGFPKDRLVQKAWRIAIRRCHETRKTLWKPSYHHKICRAHFKPTDFAPTIAFQLGASTNRSRFRLKKEAIPSIFPWSVNKLEDQCSQGNDCECSHRNYLRNLALADDSTQRSKQPVKTGAQCAINEDSYPQKHPMTEAVTDVDQDVNLSDDHIIGDVISVCQDQNHTGHGKDGHDTQDGDHNKGDSDDLVSEKSLKDHGNGTLKDGRGGDTALLPWRYQTD